MRIMNYIIIYKQSNQTKSVQLSQALNGYIDYSNGGKYKYRRKGLLEKIQYWNPIKGVYIVENKKDKDSLIETLERYKTEYYLGKIKFLNGADKQLTQD